MLSDLKHSAYGTGWRESPWRYLFTLVAACVALVSSFHLKGTTVSDHSKAMDLIREHCLPCHHADKAKGGLIMESRQYLLEGSDSGPVVIPGNPSESFLLATLPAESESHMPPEGQLSNEAITTLTQWIAEGMPWDEQRLRATESKQAASWFLEPLPKDYHPVLSMALASEHSTMITTLGSDLAIVELDKENPSMQRLITPHKDAIRSLAVDRDRHQWITGGFGRMLFWDAHTGEVLDEITDGLLGRITQLMISHDQTRLIACESLPGWSGNMHLFDLERRVPLFTWEAHKDEIFDCVETGDGSYWITASADHTIKLWESDTYREHDWLEGHTAPVMALAIHGDEGLWISAGNDRTIKVWERSSAERLYDLGRNHAYSLVDLAWDKASSRLYAINQRGDFYRYSELQAHSGAQSSNTGREKVLHRMRQPASSLMIWPEAQYAIIGTFSGALHAFTLDGEKRWELPLFPEPVAPAPAD